jgi:3',5'-cyclic AMP phosphodiesterase CpdA
MSSNPPQPYIDYYGADLVKPQGTLYYSFDLGDWHVIALDDGVCYSTPSACAAGSPQEKWLRDDLTAHADSACTIAMAHIAGRSSGSHANDGTKVAPLWKALAEYGVELLLSGHDHMYERFKPMDENYLLKTDGTGLVQFIVGTGGAQLRSIGSIANNSDVRSTTVNGVLQLTLRANAYDWKFVPIKGQTANDAGTGSCYVKVPPPPPPIDGVAGAAGAAGAYGNVSSRGGAGGMGGTGGN